MFFGFLKTLNGHNMLKYGKFRNFAIKLFVRRKILNTVVFFIYFYLHKKVELILERPAIFPLIDTAR